MNRNGSRLEGLFITAVLGVVLLLIAAFALNAQQPRAWVEPAPKTDTTVQVTPNQAKPILFGFARSVIEQSGLPATAPARSYCVRAQSEGADIIAIDSIYSRAEMELPACDITAGQVPLVIRPLCELSFAEHVIWRLQKIHPVILFCGTPPKVFLLPGGMTGGKSA